MMSHDVVTVDDDDPVVCVRCTFKNESTSSSCDVCSASLHNHHQGPPSEPHQPRVCQACTYANGGGALACSMCQTPLVDDVEGGAGGGMLVEDGELGSVILWRLAGESLANS